MVTDEMKQTVVIIGVGYIGLELSKTFSRKFNVIGYDISSQRIDYLNTNHQMENTTFQTTLDNMKGAALYLISTTTSLSQNGDINLDHVQMACENVANLATKGSTIVLESSVAIGTTRKLLGKLRSKDIYIGFSPERVDPGRLSPQGHEIPKVIAGIDQQSLFNIHLYYNQVYHQLHPVESLETAEMTKLFENCFRMVNIAFVNEMADNCEKWGIDPYQVVDAASTKPFGYMPFTPGVGVGGPCIPVNPYYLFTNNQFPLLKTATKLMESRPIQLAQQLSKSLQNRQRILVAGIAFKPGQSIYLHSANLQFAKT
ncbi:hypothetical protein BC833DRAFT_613426, partial [Globomyces pollinis-pini]